MSICQVILIFIISVFLYPFRGFNQSHTVQNEQPVFIIDSPSKLLPIESRYVRMLADTEKNYSLEDLKDLEFQPISEFPSPNQRANRSVYWTKIIFENQLETNTEYWIPISADFSRSYLIKASGTVEESLAGSMIPFTEKTVQIHKRRLSNYLPIRLNAGEKAAFFIKNEYPGLEPKLRDIHQMVTPQHAELKHLKESQNVNFSNGFFQAVLLILILYCIFHALFAKRRFAVWLTIYCMLNSLFFLQMDGYLYTLNFIADTPILAHVLVNSLVNLSIVSELLFTREYADLKTRLPVWNKIFGGMIGFGLIVIASNIVLFSLRENNTGILLTSLFQVIYLILRVFFLIKIWQIKDIKIRIFSLALSALFIISLGAWLAQYFITPVMGVFLLKTAVAVFVFTMVISLSYFSVKSLEEKLILEKEAVRHQYLVKEEENRRLKTEKEKDLLEIQARELKNTNDLKSRFFANVSHELRTPLTLILAPLKTVLKSGELNQRNHHFLNIVRQNAQSLLGLVNQILDLSRLDSGKLELKEKPVKLYDLMLRLQSQFESRASVEGIELILDFQLDPHLKVQLDKTKFETIYNNLLSNALKFTPKKGRILVSLRKPEHSVSRPMIQLSVKDTGRGIHSDDLPHIFDRFYQAKKEQKTNGTEAVAEGGSGIGLAICRDFAELMNGQINVKSELGKGTEFIFEFPRVDVIAANTEEEKIISAKNEFEKYPQNLKTQNNKITGKSTVLLVEDNHHLRDYISLILTDSGYEVVTAMNGREAVQKLSSGFRVQSSELEENSELRTLNPELIISDLMMPEMDGFQLLKKLKADPTKQSIPFIMLTARKERKDKLKALRIGVDDYLTKPFEEEELLVRMENLLKNAAVRQSVGADYYVSANDVGDKKTKSATKTEIPKTADADSQKWLNHLESVIDRKTANFNYTVDQFAQDMKMSKRQLSRRLKTLIGMTPAQYLKTYRLNKARQMLSVQNDLTVKSVALSVGYKDIAHFSRLFKEEFGKYPSEFGREEG